MRKRQLEVPHCTWKITMCKTTYMIVHSLKHHSDLQSLGLGYSLHHYNFKSTRVCDLRSLCYENACQFFRLRIWYSTMSFITSYNDGKFRLSIKYDKEKKKLRSPGPECGTLTLLVNPTAPATKRKWKEWLSSGATFSLMTQTFLLPPQRYIFRFAFVVADHQMIMGTATEYRQHSLIPSNVLRLC